MVKVGDIRVRFQYMLQKVAANGRVPLTVVREGKELKLELPVAARRPMLIPDLDGTYPSYFVYGPLVFSSATQLFLAGLNNAAHGSLPHFLCASAIRAMLPGTPTDRPP